MAFSGEIGRLIGNSAVHKFQNGRNEAVVEGALKRAVEILTPQLPIRIDEMTVLQSAISSEDTTIYFYELENLAVDIDDERFQKDIRDHISMGICSTPEMVELMEIGGKYKYVYRSSDNVQIASLHFDKSACRP
ncbi:unnamed protein product [Chrysoparadoxa australica]